MTKSEHADIQEILVGFGLGFLGFFKTICLLGAVGRAEKKDCQLRTGKRRKRENGKEKMCPSPDLSYKISKMFVTRIP